MISPMIDMRMTGDEIVALCGVPSSQSETAECFLETKRISGMVWCGDRAVIKEAIYRDRKSVV